MKECLFLEHVSGDTAWGEPPWCSDRRVLRELTSQPSPQLEVLGSLAGTGLTYQPPLLKVLFGAYLKLLAEIFTQDSV